MIESALSEAQRAALPALLDTLVPASDDGTMPSAAEVGFDAYLVTNGEGVLPMLRTVLDQLDDGFAAGAYDARHARVTEIQQAQPQLFAGLLASVYDCYYQDDRVRDRIGVVRGPVFPQGNEVVQGDLSLLDPVIDFPRFARSVMAAHTASTPLHHCVTHPTQRARLYLTPRKS